MDYSTDKEIDSGSLTRDQWVSLLARFSGLVVAVIMMVEGAMMMSSDRKFGLVMIGIAMLMVKPEK